MLVRPGPLDHWGRPARCARAWGSSEGQALGGSAGCSFDLDLIKRGGRFSGPTPDQAIRGVSGCSFDRDLWANRGGPGDNVGEF